MIIRWLGAFRKFNATSLHSAIEWELSSNKTMEVAAEIILKGDTSKIKAKVGLLVDQDAVVRTFDGDVWSERKGDGKLYATRSPFVAYSDHKECFCRPSFKGIVIKRKGGHINDKLKKTIIWFAQKHQIPIFWLVTSSKGDYLEEANMI